MKSSRVPLKLHPDPEIARAMAACRFFTVDQAIVWVLSAYRQATASLRPPSGEPWVIEGCAWAGVQNFSDAFEHQFHRHLWDAQERSGLFPSDVSLPEGPVFCALQGDKLPQCGDDQAASKREVPDARPAI